MKDNILIGVDTGGTFTDFVYYKKGIWGTLKIPSTPGNPADAVLNGLKLIKKEKKAIIVHGSTVATNAILERKGAKTALVTNKGFEDILEIARQSRDELYSLTWSPKIPLIPKELRFGIKGRILKDGTIYEPLDENEIREFCEVLKKKEIASVAVCLLFSFVNPSHEKEVGRLIREKGIEVSLSSEILSEFREYERTSTTVINAYVSPLMKGYLNHLESQLREHDSLRIMQSNGGSISSKEAMKEPVRTILSGPAGGVVGGMAIAKAAGFQKAITFDMGGTSTDVSLVDEGIKLTTEGKIGGFAVKVPMIDIHTVGAGGGSIAYIDEGGALRVGPISAGADPGPICYGKGEEITVTDANLMLSRLIPEYFLGGKMALNKDRIIPYFEKMSSFMGLSPIELAEGIISVVNSAMEKAIRVISIERGYDAREFVIVAFGGAGGMHAPYLAKLLGIPKVLIPENPGALSAWGMLMADIIRDYSQTVMLRHPDRQVLDEFFSSLKARALEDMAREEVKEVVLEHYLDMRYKGQSYELTVPLCDNPEEAFHKAHEKRYGYKDKERETEIVNIRLRAIGVSVKPELQKRPLTHEKPPEEAYLGTKKVIFDLKEKDTPIYLREKLLPGNAISGPAIVVEYTSTTVIPPFSKANVDEFGNLLIEVKE